jgi:hypothetical protein
MADIKFACPHCSQHITCDELWGGHQLDCPVCKNPLTVPAMAAPQKPVAHVVGSSLVPKPSEAAEPRLAINSGKAAEAAAGAPQRTIPIRNLAPAVKKKKSPWVTYGTAVAVLLVLGAAGYFGYGYLYKAQDEVNSASKAAAKNADGGEVAHIAKLQKTLDATDPNRIAADAQAGVPRKRRSAAGQDSPAPASSDPNAASANNSAANAADTQPLIPAVWTLDLTKAHIPSGRVNGSISGTNFIADTARVDPVANAQVLRLLQGQVPSPDREVMIYLHLKPGEKIGGQTLNVSPDMAGTGVPQVTKRWKTNPKFAPQNKSFTSGYALRLELGQQADGAVPGKIFLALPDADQSVVAGTFKAVINTNVPTMDATAQVAQPMTPMPARSYDATFDARYGIRRSQ